jgi:hypothetical protein
LVVEVGADTDPGTPLPSPLLALPLPLSFSFLPSPFPCPFPSSPLLSLLPPFLSLSFSFLPSPFSALTLDQKQKEFLREVTSILDPKMKNFYLHHCKLYAELLFRWGLAEKHAEILKFLSDSSSLGKDLIFGTF